MTRPAATSPAHADRYPLGPAVVRHRKNAAEWVMWALLWPLAWVARVWGARAGRRCGNSGGA